MTEHDWTDDYNDTDEHEHSDEQAGETTVYLDSQRFEQPRERRVEKQEAVGDR